MLVMLLTACTTTVRFPPDLWAGEGIDTGFGRQVFVNDAAATCGDPIPGWDINTWTSGFAGSASVEMVHLASGRRERHPLTLLGTDPDTNSDQFGTQLSVVTSGPILGRSSVFSCSDLPELGFVTTVYTRFGELSDCMAFGPKSFEVEAAMANDPEIALPGGCTIF